MVGGVSWLYSLVEILHVAFFMTAIFVCPLGFLIGVVGSMVMFSKKKKWIGGDVESVWGLVSVWKLFFFDENLSDGDRINGSGVFTHGVGLSGGGGNDINYFYTLGDLTENNVVFG